MNFTNIVKWVAFSLIMVLLIVSIIKFIPWERKIYCRAEFHKDNIHLNISECMIMRIVSDQKLDYERLFDTEVQCSKRLKKLEPCYGAERYYTEYRLTSFCEHCDIGGKFCMGSWITYHNYTEAGRILHERRYIARLLGSDDELIDMIKDCSGDLWTSVDQSGTI